MTLPVVETDLAPAAIGPDSQAVVAGGILYVSGQVPGDPKTGEIMSGGISAQTKQVLDNFRAVVEAAEGEMGKVVKVTTYLTDMQRFSVVNEIYGTYFFALYPARACVQVSKLPTDADIEMDAIVN